MPKTRKVLTINAAHCVWCGRQTAGAGCDCRTDVHDAAIGDECDCETCQARREYTRKRNEHIDRMRANSHGDDCLCTPCSTRRLHREETAMTDNDLDDTDDLPGYKPARNTQPMDDELEPIPVEPIDYAELSAFGEGVTSNAAGESDADGLTVNEAAPGGLPVIGLDYEAMSVFRPRR